jgi:hypothetical protein
MSLTVTVSLSDPGLTTEVAAVRRQLQDALAELRGPLGELVKGQLSITWSLPRIGMILAAGFGEIDTAQQQEQRILLAAALEMLHLAQHIHKLLSVRPESRHAQEMNKSWVGSIILAGDYCFSRSASLAAQTNNPQVVKNFAQALKQTSEGHLRSHFQTEQSWQDEDEALLSAGLISAAALAALSPEQNDQLQLARQQIGAGEPLELAALPAFQRLRWQAVEELRS